jgi:Zn-dependent protease with chaperone function
MARKARRRRAKRQQLGLEPHDYQFPGEKNSYWVAMGVTIGLFVWLAFMVWVLRYQMFPAHQLDALPVIGIPKAPAWWMLNLLVYPWVAIALANVLATRHSAADIKKAGRQARVAANNHPELHQLLATLARTAGMKLPQMYLLSSDSPYIYTIPGGSGTIVLSTGLRDGLEEAELKALIAHELGHINSHHVRTTLAIKYITNANPVFKVLFFPVLIIKLFSGGWADLAEFSSDRFAVLVTDNSEALNVALVRQAVLADKQADITPEELEAYLSSAGDISTDSTQMERHFRIGSFIGTQPNLQERISQIRDYLSSDEYSQGREKMEQLRSRLGGS